MKQEAKKRIEETIEIPEGVETTIEGRKLIVKGKIGVVERTVVTPLTKIKKEDNKLILYSPSKTRKGKRMIYTFKSHITNMIRGAEDGFKYTLKICSGHFPMTIKADGNDITITNFLGEKIPRKAKIIKDVNVKIEKDTITVESANKEAAGQTAANIEKATKIPGRDKRVFQDGCYIIEKPGRK